MDVVNMVDLKQIIDEMDYDCRSANPVHYKKIINKLKELHSLCKTDEDRKLFTNYLSAASSPLVIADLIQAELDESQENLTDIAINDVYPVKEVVDEQARENAMLRQMMSQAAAEPTVEGLYTEAEQQTQGRSI